MKYENEAEMKRQRKRKYVLSTREAAESRISRPRTSGFECFPFLLRRVNSTLFQRWVIRSFISRYVNQTTSVLRFARRERLREKIGRQIRRKQVGMCQAQRRKSAGERGKQERTEKEICISRGRNNRCHLTCLLQSRESRECVGSVEQRGGRIGQSSTRRQHSRGVGCETTMEGYSFRAGLLASIA